MRNKLLIFGAIALVFTSPIAAQDHVPDYLAYQGKVDRYVMAAISVPYCMRLFGYQNSSDALLRVGRGIIDDAVLGGMPEGSATTLMVGALEAEGDRQVARIKSPDDRDQTREYWRRRCEMHATDPEYGSYFRK